MFMVNFFILVCSTISLFSWRFWIIFVDSLSEFLIFFIGYHSFFGTAFLKNRVSAFFLSICFLSFFVSICFLSVFLYLSILVDFVVFLVIYFLQIFSQLNLTCSLGESLLAEVVKRIRKYRYGYWTICVLNPFRRLSSGNTHPHTNIDKNNFLTCFSPI